MSFRQAKQSGILLRRDAEQAGMTEMVQILINLLLGLRSVQ
jgi:hypothetical protein